MPWAANLRHANKYVVYENELSITQLYNSHVFNIKMSIYTIEMLPVGLLLTSDTHVSMVIIYTAFLLLLMPQGVA